MNWQSFFDISTMDHRHILAAYSVVILVNLGVFSRLIYTWFNPKP